MARLTPKIGTNANWFRRNAIVVAASSTVPMRPMTNRNNVQRNASMHIWKPLGSPNRSNCFATDQRNRQSLRLL